MRIIGLDPGTASTGYGIIDALEGQLSVVTYGVIVTPAKDEAPHRLQTIYKKLNELIAAFQPDSAGVEEVFFGRNVTTAISVGQARGVLLLGLANAGIPVSEYSPPKIKEAVTGYGKANKAQVQLMVKSLLEMDDVPRPDDAADGLAVAITHHQYYRYQSL